MSVITIPENILGIERELTANEISIYNIYAGPGGSWDREWYSSDIQYLRNYRFYLRSKIQDNNGFYYLTITKNTPASYPDEEQNPRNPQQ